MRVVLTGASGQLGAYLLDHLGRRGHDVIAWSGAEAGRRAGWTLHPVDLSDASEVLSNLEKSNPDAILHAGAVSSAEAARRTPSIAHAVNVEGTGRLADWCRHRGRRIVYTSTDLVFDGSAPWRKENDPAEPILEYGRSKRLAEPSVLDAPRGLVARLSLLYGPSRNGRLSYFERSLLTWKRGQPQTFFDDEFRTPLDLDTAASILVSLLESETTGILHVAGPERLSRFDLMRRVAEALGIDPSLVLSNRQSDVEFPEPRPADVSLDSARLTDLMPDLPRPSVESAASLFPSLTPLSPVA
jgi:dTDP-4-dehydrorhamnose reductase